MPAHMVAPTGRPKPDLGRFSSRRIAIPPTRENLEFKLLDWMQDVLDYIGQSAPIEGLHPANYLVAQADGIDLIMHAPTTMSLNGTMVYADFVWGRRASGHWFIRHVKFGLNLTQAEVSEAERRALKERLLDKAETENATHVHARAVVFPAEDYIDTWHDEITRGYNHLKYLIEEIYEEAKKEASMPENWIKGWDVAAGFAGDLGSMAERGIKATKQASDMYRRAGVEMEMTSEALSPAWEKATEFGETANELAEKAERAEKYLKAKETIEKGTQAYGLSKTRKEFEEADKEEGENKPIFRKSKADLYADLGLELVSQIPGVGGLTKGFAWMFIEMGLANYSGVVAGIRARIYSCFVGGFVVGLTLAPDSMTLKNKRDQKYYDWGRQKALHFSRPVSFRYQIALLHYAMTHYTSGDWGGTTYALHGIHVREWNYPDEWEAKWSPQLLGSSLVSMIIAQRHLVD
jgi:hypothetical protein